MTAGTTFTISPNGSCTSATCTASTAGTHTVTGNDGGKTGTRRAAGQHGDADHTVITPATAMITAGGSKTYTAQGFDAANNSLGDVTANTTFTINPNGSCTGVTCTATVAGFRTSVTGTDAGKTSSATLTVNAARSTTSRSRRRPPRSRPAARRPTPLRGDQFNNCSAT